MQESTAGGNGIEEETVSDDGVRFYSVYRDIRVLTSGTGRRLGRRGRWQGVRLPDLCVTSRTRASAMFSLMLHTAALLDSDVPLDAQADDPDLKDDPIYTLDLPAFIVGTLRQAIAEDGGRVGQLSSAHLTADENNILRRTVG